MFSRVIFVMLHTGTRIKIQIKKEQLCTWFVMVSDTIVSDNQNLLVGYQVDNHCIGLISKADTYTPTPDLEWHTTDTIV